MRLKRNRLQTVFLKPAVTQKDAEGNSYITYEDALEREVEAWPEGGKVQSERYGQRLPNIRNIRMEGKYRETEKDGKPAFELESGIVIAANDGICYAVGASKEPDYRIVGIYPYRFLTLEIERRN